MNDEMLIENANKWIIFLKIIIDLLFIFIILYSLAIIIENIMLRKYSFYYFLQISLSTLFN